MIKELEFTIKELHRAYADGLSPLDVVSEVFRRISAVGDPGIFISLFKEASVEEAANAIGSFDPALPLWGIPFVIKDNIDAFGLETTAGCPAFSYRPSEDAFAVSRLRTAGAILIGKTNLDQFAAGLVGMRSPHDPPRNAVNPELVPGGSSSGSAVAVSHGLVSFALGTDTAGSGRVPAALNSIVGLKPTRGAISSSGVVPACRTLDTISIFALTVEDAVAVAGTAYGHDKNDSFSRSVSIPSLGDRPSGLTLGVPRSDDLNFFGDQSQKDGFTKGVQALETLGVAIEEIPFDAFYDIAERLYAGAWVAERYSVIEELLDQNPDAVHPVTRQVISRGEALSALDVFRDLYALADAKAETSLLLQNLDGLCVPSIPSLFLRKEVERNPIQLNSHLGIYTNFVNLLDMCGIAVPLPPDDPMSPQSVTLLGRSGADGLIATIGQELSASLSSPLGVTGWKADLDSHPEPTEYLNGEMPIVAVGAHMSDLPLNGQLTDLGGRFIEETQTADCYRLYALSGEAIKRPGLVRQENGCPIRVEVWALPEKNVGRFLAQIPSPLGLGPIRLEDGRSVIGFLCEVAGLEGAHDISDFGGWRAYLTTTAGALRATSHQ